MTKSSVIALFFLFLVVLFIFVLVLFCCFHILTDLNYTGRLIIIASSLSAFFSKIINPRVGRRRSLIAFSVDTYNCFVA